MAYDLNLTNPIVRDLLEVWVEMRCRRMGFEPRVTKSLAKIKRQVDKFQKTKTKMERRVARAMEEAKAREEAKIREEEK